MIKMTGAGKDGRRFVLLGLSEMNLTRLREGKPVHVYGAELGTDHDIIICWGPTEDALADDLSKHFGILPEKQVKQ